MQLSAKKLVTGEMAKLHHHFVIALANLRTEDHVEQFMRDFFTDTEQQVFAKRLAIAVLLRQGSSYEMISKQLNVSTATIASVADILPKPGVQLALRQIEEDEWAENVLSKFLPRRNHETKK